MKPTWQLVLLAIGAVASILLAYIDSLPKWDDAGIIAGGLLLVSGLLTLLGYRRPWMMALAAGLWVPLRGIAVTRDLSLLVLLAFPFLGAYAGFLVRSGLMKRQRQA
jgi:hypothetical protein